MSMYDQSLGLVRAEQARRHAEARAEFFESSAKRWRRAFDALASHLDGDDPETARLIDECEQARNAIPLVYSEPTA